jgi:hypothetical protein
MVLMFNIPEEKIITLSGKLINSDLLFIPSPLRERARVRVKS